MPTGLATPAADDPLAALLHAPEGGVLAVIAGVEGPSYRPLGAMMALWPDGRRVGSLSSGCIEDDIARHGDAARAAGAARMIRYGRGSPYMDIRLPCGGGLDVLLVPLPPPGVLAEVQAARARRAVTGVEIALPGGALRVADVARTGRADGALRVRFDPPIRFVTFGKGPEAATFAALVQSAGYPNLLISPDAETRAAGARAGCPVVEITRPAMPDGLGIDARTAVVLFFHDHEWEPPILAGALDTPAFYLGAQGSRMARDARHAALAEMGVAAEKIARLHGPVGLIPSARDPGTLAVSVLAEVLARTQG